MTKTMTSLYIEEEILQAAKEEARKRGLPRQSFLREAIINAVRDNNLLENIGVKLDYEAKYKQIKKITGETLAEKKLNKSEETQIIEEEKEVIRSRSRIEQQELMDLYAKTRAELLEEKLRKPFSKDDYICLVEGILDEGV